MKRLSENNPSRPKHKSGLSKFLITGRVYAYAYVICKFSNLKPNQTKRQKRDDQEFESEDDNSLDTDQFDPDQSEETIEDGDMDIKIEEI